MIFINFEIKLLTFSCIDSIHHIISKREGDIKCNCASSCQCAINALKAMEEPKIDTIENKGRKYPKNKLRRMFRPLRRLKVIDETNQSACSVSN